MVIKANRKAGKQKRKPAGKRNKSSAKTSTKSKTKSNAIASQRVNLSAVTTCEICFAENQMGQWFVSCDACDRDYHVDCVGEGDLHEKAEWFCHQCTENESNTEAHENGSGFETSVINVSDSSKQNDMSTNNIHSAMQSTTVADNERHLEEIQRLHVNPLVSLTRRSNAPPQQKPPAKTTVSVSVHRKDEVTLEDLNEQTESNSVKSSKHVAEPTTTTQQSIVNQQVPSVQNINTILENDKFFQTTVSKSTVSSNAKKIPNKSTTVGKPVKASNPNSGTKGVGRSNVKSSEIQSLKSASVISKTRTKLSSQRSATSSNRRDDLQRIQDEFDLQAKIDDEILATKMEAIKMKEARCKKFIEDVYNAKSIDGSERSHNSGHTSKTSYVSSWVDDQQKRKESKSREGAKSIQTSKSDTFNLDTSIFISKNEIEQLKKNRKSEVPLNKEKVGVGNIQEDKGRVTWQKQSAAFNSNQTKTSGITQPPVSRSTLLPKTTSQQSTSVIDLTKRNIRPGIVDPLHDPAINDIVTDTTARVSTGQSKAKIKQPTLKENYQERHPVFNKTQSSTYQFKKPNSNANPFVSSSKPIYTSAASGRSTNSRMNTQLSSVSQPVRTSIYTESSQPAYESDVPEYPYGEIRQRRTNAVRQEQQNPTQLTQRQIAARQVIPKDLPKFDGNPYDWPNFAKRYESTTKLCGFCDDENLERLNKCLAGKAQAIVKSQLLMPECVDEIMEILFERFGRPELVMKATLAEIRAENPIKPHQLDALCNYGYKVHSACNVIEQLGLQYYLYNPELVQEILEKLPNQTRIDFAVYSARTDVITLRTLGDWLRELSRTINRIAPMEVTIHSNDKKGSKEKNSTDRSANDRTQDRKFDGSKSGFLNVHDNSKSSSKEERPRICVICNNNCKGVDECTKFKALDVDQRWEEIKTHNLCRTCLKRHIPKCNKVKECGVNGCSFKHHALLHNEVRHSKEKIKTLKRSATQDSKASTNNNKDGEKKEEVKSGRNNSHFLNIGELYRIVPVKLHFDGKVVSTYAYLDEGSAFTLLERQIADMLGLSGIPENICLLWTNDVHRQEKSENVTLTIEGIMNDQSKEPPVQYQMKGVNVVQTLNLPEQSLPLNELKKRYKHLRDVPVDGYENVIPTILIGLRHARLAVPLKTVEGKEEDGPIATKSRLGWSIYGPVNSTSTGYVNVHRVKVCPCNDRDNDLHKIVKDHFTIENFGVSINSMDMESKENQKALEMLKQFTVRKGDRFETRLLWKNDAYTLPDSYGMARKRLMCVENKGAEVVKVIDDIIQDYLEKGYASKLSAEDLTEKHPRTFYLPIFTVTNPKKPGKIRPVFDAAATVKGTSLNSTLLTGPDLLSPLVDVLRRFRENEIAFTGDIKEMFYRVFINEADRHSQRFLWRNGNKNREPDVYQFNVMTFGSKCSPSSAQFVKNKNASDFEKD